MKRPPTFATGHTKWKPRKTNLGAQKKAPASPLHTSAIIFICSSPASGKGTPSKSWLQPKRNQACVWGPISWISCISKQHTDSHIHIQTTPNTAWFLKIVPAGPATPFKHAATKQPPLGSFERGPPSGCLAFLLLFACFEGTSPFWVWLSGSLGHSFLGWVGLWLRAYGLPGKTALGPNTRCRLGPRHPAASRPPRPLAQARRMAWLMDCFNMD